MARTTVYILITVLVFSCYPPNQEKVAKAAEESATEAEELPQSTHPVWSPDGTRIAFINNKMGVSNHNAINFEVYTMNADGSNIVRHTHNTAFEAEIAWSPDGKSLAYKSYRDENDEIYIIDLATGEERNISNSPAREGSPEWSSDGQLIYFQSNRDNDKGELYAYNLSSNEILRLTDNDFNEIGATWSPDGTRILFTSNQDGDDDIYLMDLADKTLVHLTNNELMDWSPRWSPDGSKILFTYGDWNTDIFELRLINADGSGEETIMKEVDSGNATWNPDGDKIAFGSLRSGPGEIYVLDLATGTVQRITDNAKDNL